MRDTDLTTKRGQQTYLMDNLGISRNEARVLIAAFERDLERPLATADRTYRHQFLDWLMRQAPSARKPKKRKWRIGEAGWRVTT